MSGYDRDTVMISRAEMFSLFTVRSNVCMMGNRPWLHNRTSTSTSTHNRADGRFLMREQMVLAEPRQPQQ